MIIEEIKYRGYGLTLQQATKRVEKSNPISGHQWSEDIPTGGRDYWTIDGPLASCNDKFYKLEKAKEHVDYLIMTGEKFYGWTDEDRTGHQIKRKK